MGALYGPRKLKNHPNEMTHEKITQILRNITLISCMYQRINMTNEKGSFWALVGQNRDIL